jgi:hypothetical protein
MTSETKLVILNTLAPLDPQEESLLPTEQEAGWNPEQACTFWRKNKYLFFAGI